MYNPTSQKNSPVTFEIEQQLLSKLKRFQQQTKTNSLSEIIRYALNSFKFESFKNTVTINKQISIRLPQSLKDELSKFSTKKKVSIGELLRAAIQNLCLQSPNNQKTKAMIMAITTPKRPAARKPVAKKVAVKKATAKKTTAVKKPVAKKPAAKKPVAKKATVKKAVAKKPATKATVKKTAVKKTAVKKTAAKKPAAKKTTVAKKK